MVRKSFSIFFWFVFFSGMSQAAVWDAKTLLSLKQLGSFDVSPDGKWIIVSVSESKEDQSGFEGKLWLMNTQNNQKYPFTMATSPSSPKFSPSGRQIAFLNKRGDEKRTQIYVMNLFGGEARQVTDIETGVSAFQWISDDQFGLVSRVWPKLNAEDTKKKLEERAADRKSKTNHLSWEEGPVRWFQRYLDDRENHLFRYTISNKKLEPLTVKTPYRLPNLGNSVSNYFHFSRQGGNYAFARSVFDKGDIKMELIVYQGKTQQFVNLTKGSKASDQGPIWSPDGQKLAFRRIPDPDIGGAQSKLFIYDLASGKTSDSSGNWDRSFGGGDWSSDSQMLTTATADSGRTNIFQWSQKDPSFRAVTSKGSYRRPRFKGKSRSVVAMYTDIGTSAELREINLDSGNVKTLWQPNAATIKQISMPSWESITYKGANGADVQAWVIYPPKFSKSKTYPLFMALHGGPHGVFDDSFHPRWNPAIYASWGYVVVTPNFHGSIGFGQKFRSSLYPDDVTKPYEDAVALAELMAKKRYIDADNMAAGGGSYGGTLTNFIAGKKHPFKALINHAGRFNYYSQYAADYGYISPTRGDFWDKKEIFEKISPHNFVKNFRVPMLFLYGEQDFRVPIHHGLSAFHATKILGLESRLVVYPNEGHWIAKPKTRIQWFGEFESWLKKYIGS